MISVCNLSFYYQYREILKEVTLQVPAGKIIGLLGPNGSGKSTLVKILSGVLDKYHGTVYIAGRELKSTSKRERAQRLAVVPQESVFGFSFTALEIVLMGLHPHMSGLSFESKSDIEIAMQALGRCGAVDLASRPIQRLSSGERQRVVIARALAQQPKIILFDEPANFLDIRHQVELYDIVRELAHQKQCAVLTIMHDLNMAAEYCDYIYLIKQGHIIASGIPDKALTSTNLKKIFDTDVYIDINTLTKKLIISPLSHNVEYQK